MKKIKNNIKLLLILMVVQLSVMDSFSQDYTAQMIAAADTTNFSVNTSGGWQLINSYLTNSTEDSIQFELILMHPDTLNWNEYQNIGMISTANFWPQQEQTLSFDLITVWFELRVETDGQCRLKLLTGNLPGDSPVVIPLKVFYKK